MILTPWNDPFFYTTLRGELPPDFTPELNVVFDVNSLTLETRTSEEMREFLFGGEYEQNEEMGLYDGE